ncbi:MAG: Secreted protein [Candidatus Midichloria mitochondrii]|uniref:Uncharacterized protein n=1 Tax=Midichloria mitochondrii (strain IricVA) TaxID=696127 RepID=F7XU47_MIDMI|nr:hypothetical protein [Candidatus Midichloria mitochondrii]AEI89406.1 hypothetical protein midi_01129 [Candidatus Midichloria mitochondrii IricVA]MDJ1255931.1 hypothetical protein [Candidatus Midichloria mitochondrii]MDJ1287668.1 hypothetical protein [Candidatus Midichloria mitochondrii]MDJ1312711.1 hypothetical protein [Candidatus Midichloria mitochondrii]MDJ1583252.1 hypothetical protein [Candidatus Midichloria mitochondrii]
MKLPATRMLAPASYSIHCLAVVSFNASVYGQQYIAVCGVDFTANISNFFSCEGKNFCPARPGCTVITNIKSIESYKLSSIGRYRNTGSNSITLNFLKGLP